VSVSLALHIRRSGGTMRQTFSGIIFLTTNVDVKDEEPLHQNGVLYNDLLIVFVTRTCLHPRPAEKYLLAQDFYFSRELC